MQIHIFDFPIISKTTLFFSFWLTPKCDNFFNIPISTAKLVSTFVTTNAVNKLTKIPIIRVIANPFTDPDPIKYKIKAERIVVTFESTIEESACSDPALTADLTDNPFLNSSLVLS